MKKGVVVFWVIVLLLVVAGLGLAIAPAPGSHTYDSLAQCLKDKGAVFYGAFWCPHCQKTKAMFGASAHLLPYVECSTPDGKNQTQACIDKKITGYPTWIFADGSQLEGEHTIPELASKAGCPLPQ